MATAIKLKPEFKGKPIIIPKYIPHANFLEEDFGKAVLKEYKGRAKADYNNASALNVLKYENNIVKGSNPFAVVLINQIVRQEGLRTAIQVELENILKINVLNLKGLYEDYALVLRNENGPNKYLAQDLVKQIKARQNIKYPIIIPLASLDLTKDQNSEHGLAFKLMDNAEIIYAPELDNKNNGKKFSKTNEKGLPIFNKIWPFFNKKGNRTLYTSDSGLSRLYLFRYLGLASYCARLAFSYSGGRIIVVSNKATLQRKIKEY